MPACGQGEHQGARVHLIPHGPIAGDNGTRRWGVLGQHGFRQPRRRCGIGKPGPLGARELTRRDLGRLQNNIRYGGWGLGHAGFLLVKGVRSHHGRWRLILPRPASAGGRQIPEPRPGQSQLPEDVHWPRG